MNNGKNHNAASRLQLSQASTKKGGPVTANRYPRKNGDVATRRLNFSKRPTIDELQAAAAGRWVDIFSDAAGLSRELLDGRGHACPRCGGRDRFAAFKDVAQRGSVQCRRCFNADTDPRPGDGLATLRWLLNCDTVTACQWLAGWLGLASAVDMPVAPTLRRYVPLQPSRQRERRLDRFAEDCHHAMKSTWWTRLEAQLALPAAELVRLRVGWSSQHRATTWPMVNHDDAVVGVRLRSMKTGRKWSVEGGIAGVFVPIGLPLGLDRLYVAEGPTDCAALLSLGLDCIGRPSCNGAVAITTKLVKRLQPSECVIVADDDANGAGKRGAESLAVTLVTVCPAVRIIYPPAEHNDARDWVRGGATADDVESIVQAAAVKSLTMTGGAL